MNLLNNAILKVPTPVNEPVYSFAPGTPERDLLKAAIDEISSKKVEIPLIIGGKEVRTGKMGKIVMPHDHQHVLGEYHIAGEKEINMAIDAAMDAKEAGLTCVGKSVPRSSSRRPNCFLANIVT